MADTQKIVVTNTGASVTALGRNTIEIPANCKDLEIEIPATDAALRAVERVCARHPRVTFRKAAAKAATVTETKAAAAKTETKAETKTETKTAATTATTTASSKK